MAEATRHSSRWIAFLAGGVVMAAVALALLAWWSGQSAISVLQTGVDMPALQIDAPPMPQAPRLPDGPTPRPG